ncbi:hypothetical protein QCA50_015094 [Cerrena zonata]|uniref:Uncharacterized protein n=1 Tax=Cerrena zonata TaxID=2478898 RepID=A0AAW0FWQ8_9APHY
MSCLAQSPACAKEPDTAPNSEDLRCGCTRTLPETVGNRSDHDDDGPPPLQICETLTEQREEGVHLFVKDEQCASPPEAGYRKRTELADWIARAKSAALLDECIRAQDIVVKDGNGFRTVQAGTPDAWERVRLDVKQFVDSALRQMVDGLKRKEDNHCHSHHAGDD